LNCSQQKTTLATVFDENAKFACYFKIGHFPVKKWEFIGFSAVIYISALLISSFTDQPLNLTYFHKKNFEPLEEVLFPAKQFH
jgi:hypothetical protein